MPENPPTENTLPSLRHIVARETASPRYTLTLVFHPQTGRIGTRAHLPLAAGRAFALGRHAPLFGSGDGALPLDDPYLSRRALLLVPEGEGLRLRRPQSSSRCRVYSGDLLDEVYLDAAQLRAGVPLRFAHSVVALLRREEGPAPATRPPPDCGLVGTGPAVVELRRQVAQAARSGEDVLIRGETGTGKELVAGAIYALGERSQRPLVRVNMAAIPPGLAAASLFGSNRGAYTGASSSQQGYFQQAEGGILFLDEVGDTPAEVQPLLLRALQEREIQGVGGRLRKIDVRVISATDQALEEGDGCNFRAALRHRLGALEIGVPALRDRREDIGILLAHFLRRAEQSEGYRVLGQKLDDEAVARWADIFYAFLCYDWPGNVRQLANFATRVVLASEGRAVLPASLAAELVPAGPAATDTGSGTVRRLSEISDEELGRVMGDCRYEIAAVAQELGVSRQSVYRRINGSTAFRLACDVPAAELHRVIGQCSGDVRAAAEELAVSESALRARLRNGGLSA